MTDEEIDAKRRTRKRFCLWILILIAISSGNMVIAPNPLPNPEYVPTIVNGLVTATSILVAFALFSFTHFHTTIRDKNERRRYHLLTMIYSSLLFILITFDIMLGYRFVLTGELGYAYSWFMTLLIIVFGIVVDMWIVSDQFYLK